MAEEKKKTNKNEEGRKASEFQKQLNALQEELKQAKDKREELEKANAEWKDKYLRLMAEFDTFRRRSSEEKLALVDSAASDTIKGLLPVLDDCERAMQILAGSADEAAREGTSLIYNKLMDYLKTRGLTPIEAEGCEFDTDLHEAVTQFPAPGEEQKGKVLQVVQTGYLLKGKVLRYAKVVVGA